MIAEFVLKAFTPKTKEPIGEWADKHIYLGPRQPTAFKGRYKSDRVPYFKKIWSTYLSMMYTHITLCFGAQTGKTLNGSLIPVCYFAMNEPDPMIVCFPSVTLAQSRSESSLIPLFEDSKTLQTILPDDRRSHMKKLEYLLKTCVINLIGGHSASSLSSRPARVAIIEEADKFPEQDAKEASAQKLLKERIKTFWNKLFIENSTPTIEAAYMWQTYLAGTQSLFYVPCQKCGTLQPIEFEDICYDKNEKGKYIRDSARWKCRHCSHLHTNKQKKDAVSSDKADWIATAEPVDPRHISFRLPAWYAMWVSLDETVLEFESSKDKTNTLQNFINSWCAEAWTPPPIEKLDEEKIIAIQKEFQYERELIPTDKEYILFADVDVQMAHCPFAIWAMDRHNLWLVDWGNLSVLEDIPLLCQNKYEDLNGGLKTIQFCMLDTGHRTMECYKIALKHKWIKIIKGEKGNITQMVKPVKPSKLDSFPTGVKFGGRKELVLYHIHPRYFKDQLAESISRTNDISIWFPEGIEQNKREYIKQLVAEELISDGVDKYGMEKTKWFKPSGKVNDQFDLAQYAMAAHHLCTGVLMTLNIKKEAEKQNKGGEQKNSKGQYMGEYEISIDPDRIKL